MSALFVTDLLKVPTETVLTCDVLIIGGGPAGLSVAEGLSGSGIDVLIAESGGLEECSEIAALNEVICEEGTWTCQQELRRREYHGQQAVYWSHSVQKYGVRCRMLGGSTAAWAGKSAIFDEWDFAERSWVSNSGWPIRLDHLKDYLDRAANYLNLGPNCYDDTLWQLMNRAPPSPQPDPSVLQSFFWQFARSRLDPMDVMRVGAEFISNSPANCRVLTRATAVELLTDAGGTKTTGAFLSNHMGVRRKVRAKTVVLAASAIENARLLLNSTKLAANGIGNQNDMVGRYLLDHPAATVGKFPASQLTKMSQLYGFYGVRTASGTNMYMRGASPTIESQRSHSLLNCAAFMPAQRAIDNPWDALKRLAKRRSEDRAADVLAIIKSPGLLIKGAGRRALQSKRMPVSVAELIVRQIVRFKPEMAADEYLTAGIPHKLTGLSVDAICEQVPDANNRVTLSQRTDRFGVPLPFVRWSVGDQEKDTLIRFAHLLSTEFRKCGLPPPVLDEWVVQRKGEDAEIIDMAHSAGTTRMAASPKQGVVDENCQVHGVDGLFIAGASVFPTIGHVNPTLMIVALSFRLADRIKKRAGHS